MKKKVLGCLLILCILCGCGESNEDYLNGQTLYEEEKYVEAIQSFELCKDYKDASDYIEKCYERLGTQFVKNKEFDKAMEQYEKLSDKEQSQELIIEATYLQAKEYKENKKYTDAYYTYEKVKDYQDATKQMEDLLFLKKYEYFDFEKDDEEYEAFYNLYGGEFSVPSTAQEVDDKFIQGYYGEWYHHESNNQLYLIDKYYINGRAYHVLAINGNKALISFDDEPNEKFTLYKMHDYYIGQDLDIMNIKTGEGTFLHDVTYDEWNAEKSKIPNYTDQEIVSKLETMMKDRIGSNYDGVERLYHMWNVEESNVVYESLTSTYVCHVTLTYSTNMFDFWGMSNTTYYGSAVFMDTGDGLITVEFNIN